MKTIFIAACGAILLACNNNSDHTNHGEPDTNHSTSDRHTNKDKNEITASMDKMMHDMHAAKPGGNNDVDFASMMIDHHKGAVEMSKIQLEKGSNEELKQFAQKVIDDQNKEITFMQNFISQSKNTQSVNSAAFQKALQNSMAVMMSGHIKIYNDIDKDFAAQMIPHHQSAVDMANAYLKFGNDPGLKTLSQNIIDSQAKEIDWLQLWLNNNGG